MDIPRLKQLQRDLEAQRQYDKEVKRCTDGLNAALVRDDYDRVGEFQSELEKLEVRAGGARQVFKVGRVIARNLQDSLLPFPCPLGAHPGGDGEDGGDGA